MYDPVFDKVQYRVCPLDLIKLPLLYTYTVTPLPLAVPSYTIVTWSH